MDDRSDEVTRANVDKRTARKLFREDFMREIKKIRTEISTPTTDDVEFGHIDVAIRVRPLFPKEIKNGAFEMISCLDPYIMVHDCRMHADMRHMFIDTTTFAFGKIFSTECTNEEIYQMSGKNLVMPVLSGKGNSTLIMYGQTGTGKTYTMSAIQDQMIADIFSIPAIKKGHVQINICCFEISGKKCYDLLNRKEEVFLREGDDKKIHVRGITYFPINKPSELVEYIESARSERTTSSTKMNEQSSRTHAIVRIVFDYKEWAQPYSLTMVDLAGSEMSGDSMYHTAEQRREGAEINTSLMALKECVRKASEGSDYVHIPYRMHPLTMVLKECFESINDHTLLIATVAPDPKDTEHSMNTLHSASKMGNSDKYTVTEKREVNAKNDENDVLVAPIRFTTEELRNWMSTCSKGRFKKYVTNLPATMDGKMFIRLNDLAMKGICDNNPKIAELLRKEFNKAIEAEKEQKKLRQANIREQGIRDRLTKAKAI